MTKEKQASLTKYALQMRDRLNSPVPAKWAHSPESYKAFLTRELKITNAKLDAVRLAADAVKAGK